MTNDPVSLQCVCVCVCVCWVYVWVCVYVCVWVFVWLCAWKCSISIHAKTIWLMNTVCQSVGDTCTPTHTHTPTHRHTPPHTQSQIFTHIVHTPTHTHTHTHTHAHTPRTHIHPYTHNGTAGREYRKALWECHHGWWVTSWAELGRFGQLKIVLERKMLIIAFSTEWTLTGGRFFEQDRKPVLKTS